MIEILDRDRAGRSAARKHREVARAWRRRNFGRWTALALWVALGVVIVGLTALHLSSRWALVVGLMTGMLVMGVRLMPDALMPGYIVNWQLGAWGEQNTASELARLPRTEWVVRHDVRWGEPGNHDHVVAGRAAYVLNTKNVKDSRVTVEGGHLRLQRIDDPSDGYLADRWVPSAAAEARALERALERSLGFPVACYPVIVVWGAFEAEAEWVDEVAVVRGDRIATWIASRPADLLTAEKRARLADCVRALPRAE